MKNQLLLEFVPQRGVWKLIVSLVLLSAAVFLGAQQGRLQPQIASATHTVSCQSDLPVRVNETMTWRATVSGGSGDYTYLWSGTEGLSGTEQTITKTYSTTGFKSARVTVTDVTVGDMVASPDCMMHVMPSTFSEPPSVNPVIWVPADVDPDPMVPMLERRWREIQAQAQQAFGKTFLLKPLTVVRSANTEKDICGGDCTDLGLADTLMSTAIAESRDAIGGIIPYEREMVVLAWGAGGWAGGWSWNNPQAGVGDWGVGPLTGVMGPELEPDSGVAPFLGFGDAGALFSLSHEMDHSIGWTEIHNNDYFNPATLEPREIEVAMAGPWFTETLSDQAAPTVSITSPSGGALLSGTVVASIDATDETAMDAVVLSIDDVFWAVDDASPYSFDVDTLKLNHGVHTVTAKAFDATGNTASASITIEVENLVPGGSCDASYPVGTFRACYFDGIGFSGPFLGSAIDAAFPRPAPNVQWGPRPQFSSGRGALGQFSTVSAVWRGLIDIPPGGYEFRVVSDDGFRVYLDEQLVIDQWVDGVHHLTFTAVISKPVKIKVEWYQNGGAQQFSMLWYSSCQPLGETPPCDARFPEVALTNPADGETVSGTVSLEAAASDNMGVAYVEFYVDGALLGTDATSPYAASWDMTGLAHGSSHTIIARAYDGSAGGDADNDGFANDVESYLGTHPGSACPGTPTADDEAVDAWPPDLNDDGFITSADLSLVSALVGQSVPPAPQRYDLNADGFITSADLSLVSALVGQGCWDDLDNDGFTNDVESYLGTDPGRACPATAVANDEAVDAWPPDFNDDQFVDISDVAEISALFGATQGDPNYDPRYDLNVDGFIDISDLAVVSNLFGQGCTQANFEESAAVTVTVLDVTPPEVSITSPIDGSTVQRNTTTTISASASDISGVARVEYWVDDSLQCTGFVEPYECAWDVPAKPGVSYILEARAYDAVGNTASYSISVQSSQARG